jgi:dihydrofolate reductase
VTYKLRADFWPTVVANPTGNKSMDEFAVRIENISKVVFSRTLKEAGWKNATLATRRVEDEVMALKQQPGADILVGSPGLILATMRLGLFDEYRICVHPVVMGDGLPLFKHVDRTMLRLVETRCFTSGSILLCYEPLIG